MIKPTFCKSCGTKFIYLESENINPKTNKFYLVPVEVSSLSKEDKEKLNLQTMIKFNSQRHISHFKTCPDRDKFSSKNDLKLVGYFVYLVKDSENKIQSEISKDFVKISELQKHLQELSPRKIYKIGSRYKLNNVIEDKFN